MTLDYDEAVNAGVDDWLRADGGWGEDEFADPELKAERDHLKPTVLGILTAATPALRQQIANEIAAGLCTCDKEDYCKGADAARDIVINGFEP